MKPRPLLRRVSFWLGLFVACFLAWAWRDSYRNEAYLLREGRDGFVQCIRAEGGTFFAAGRWEKPSLQERVIAKHAKGLGISNWSQMWASYGNKWVRVPDSLVFFSFVGLWGGWLAFPGWLRKRRLGRVEKALGAS